MSVHLPRKVIEHLGTLQDGYYNNHRDHLDDGDTFNGRYVTDENVATDENLERFLKEATGYQGKIDIIRNDWGDFQYLVYRHSWTVGDTKIIDAQGRNRSVFNGYQTPASEWSIDRQFDTKYRNCYGDWQCQSDLQTLLRNYKNSSRVYSQAYNEFKNDYRTFYNDWDVNDGDVESLLRSLASFQNSANYYARDKRAFENYAPYSAPRYPDDPTPPSDPIDLPSDPTWPTPPSDPVPLPPDGSNNPDKNDDF